MRPAEERVEGMRSHCYGVLLTKSRVVYSGEHSVQGRLNAAAKGNSGDGRCSTRAGAFAERRGQVAVAPRGVSRTRRSASGPVSHSGFGQESRF